MEKLNRLQATYHYGWKPFSTKNYHTRYFRFQGLPLSKYQKNLNSLIDILLNVGDEPIGRDANKPKGSSRQQQYREIRASCSSTFARRQYP